MRQPPERLREPVPFIVEALPTFKRGKIKHVLDLGCGVGRHCIYLAKNGFDVVGIDVSESALRMAKEWARQENTKNVAFTQAAMTNIPLGDCHFDAVISVSVIHHAVKRDIIKTIDEIHRILKRNSLFLANLASVRDHRYGTGKKVEADTFRIWEAFEERRFEELHHFFTRQEVCELVACFSRVKIEALKDPHYWKTTAIK